MALSAHIVAQPHKLRTARSQAMALHPSLKLFAQFGTRAIVGIPVDLKSSLCHSAATSRRSIKVTAELAARNEAVYCSIPPPPLDADHPVWTSAVWASPLDIRRKIFCNRSLNMKQIKCVGFDMDYTLAQYKPETFEAMAHKQTVEKLVTVFQYPSILYELDFDWMHMMRGLVIDKKRGNVLKIDRHKYVKVAYHGFHKMSSSERDVVYHNSAVRDSFDEPDYAMIDTLFSLAEAYLFSQLVVLRDKSPELLPAGKGYAELYRDVRAAVDLCHRDGSLKKNVASNPSKYIHKDPLLPQMLDMYRRSGRSLFLATNSLWDYTHVVMNYLLTGRTGQDRNEDWLDYFDAVVVGSRKPDFFTSKQLLYAVETSTGKLVNTDNGAPILPIDDDEDMPSGSHSSALYQQGPAGAGGRGKVFQGGTYLDLHRLLGVRSGSQVLYVGDHIYGDILKSKKELGWRTCLVVPELEMELFKRRQTAETYRELQLLRQARDTIDDRIQRMEWALRPQHHHAHNGNGAAGPVASASRAKNEAELERLNAERDELKRRHSSMLQAHHEEFHPVWGQLLKTGHQNSRFANQVERHACLYTSHVSNLIFHSPEKSYMSRVDVMAHEDNILGAVLDLEPTPGP